MAHRLSRSYKEQNIDSIAQQRRLQDRSVRRYFEGPNQELIAEYPGYSTVEVEQELRTLLAEIDLHASFAILSTIEAAFRIDYASRCELRRKDTLSRHFREIFKAKRYGVNLADDILAGWERHAASSIVVFSELRQAFKFRHWLAHGRYWLLKADVSRFDFNYLYTIADLIRKDLLSPVVSR